MCLALYSWKFCSLASHKLGKTVRLVIGLPNQCSSGSMFRGPEPFHAYAYQLHGPPAYLAR